MIFGFLKGAIIIAAVATLIAFAATFWYVWIVLGVIVFFVLKGYHKQKDARNRV